MAAFPSCADLATVEAKIKEYDVISGDATVTVTPATVGNKTTFDLSVSGAAETVTAITNALAAGHTIGTYTNEAGTAVTLKESIVTLAFAAGVLTLTDEAGVETDITLPVGTTVSIAGALTAGHTIGTVTIDGTDTALKETITALSLTGSTLKYTDEAGTETSITLPSGGAATEVASAGKTLTVTGTSATGFNLELPRAPTTPSGLTNSLVFDEALGGWYSEGSDAAAVRMSKAPGTQQAIASGAGLQVRVNVDTANPLGNAALITPDIANKCVKLKAGFTYEFSADISVELGGANNTMSFQFATSTVGATGPWTNRQLVGTISGPQATTNKVWTRTPSGMWAPTVDTWLTLLCISSNGAGNQVNLDGLSTTAVDTGVAWVVKKVGKI